MAASISTRIPWRTFSRLRVSANPVFTNAFKTQQCAAAPAPVYAVRYASNASDIPDAIPTPASTSTPAQATFAEIASAETASAETASAETTSAKVQSTEPASEDLTDEEIASIINATNSTDSTEQYNSAPEDMSEDDVRLPRSVQAIYLRPLRREAEHGVPSCDLQLRSYNVRNLEFFSDFALRAAYYLNLPAYGPVPLPRITQRWTVPRGHFIHKKSQENFERRTVRRLIQIRDGHPETVQLWLAFLRKHAYYGIGMKANVWEYNELGVGKLMDASMEEMKEAMEPEWELFGRKQNAETADKVMEILNRENFRAATGTSAPMMKPEP